MNAASAKELFILGRVSLRPTHGHEIMRTLRASHADLWVELSEKHVYYILKKLERDGLIAVAELPDGKLPARKVYAITDAGSRAFATMLVADNLVEATPYSEFDVLFGMLCYSDAIPASEKDDILSRRRGVLVRLRAELESAHAESPEAGAPRIMLEKVTRNVTHELNWLDEISATIEREGWDSLKPTFADAGGEA